jgi:hypothetical protein
MTEGENRERGNDADTDRDATQRDAATEARNDQQEEFPQKEPAIPQVAPDTPSGRFGAQGQITISSDAGLFIENTSQSGSGAPDGSTTTLQLRPAMDYFVADNLSLGGFLGIDYTEIPSGHTTTWAIGPRVGYNVPFSDRFSIWPKAGLAFTSTSIAMDPPASDSTSTNLALNLFVPVMFHPVEHFFLGFGPALDQDLTGDVKTTTIAGRLTIGGWFRSGND